MVVRFQAALASSYDGRAAKWLLTLDEGDFHAKLAREVYGLKIATPGEFLLELRTEGPALRRAACS